MSTKVKLVDENCNICDKQLNTWDIKCSKATAYKIPVCEHCIAKEYDMDVDSLRNRLEDFFGLRPCQGV